MLNYGKSAAAETADQSFYSVLLLLSAVLLSVGALFAVPGIINLFDLELTERFVISLWSMEIREVNVQQSWLIVRGLAYVLAAVVPVLTAVGLWITYFGSLTGRGRPRLKYFAVAAKVFHLTACVVGILLAALFLFRAIRYLAVNVTEIGGVLFIAAMLLPECVMAAVVAIIMVLTIRGAKSAVNTAENIRYNLLTGKYESYGLGSGPVVLLSVMAAAAVALCVIFREETLTVLSFALPVPGYILLAVWLGIYRRRVGRCVLEEYRVKKRK